MSQRAANFPIFAAPFLGVLILSALFLCLILVILLPPLYVLVPVVSVALGFAVYRWPVVVIAVVLLLMPFLPLPLQGLKATGYGWVEAASALKEIGLLFAATVLAFRNGFKLEKVDRWIIALMVWAIAISLVHPRSSTAIGFKDDFDFVLAYFVGRVILLNPRWIRTGLWIAAFVALLGLIEFFFIGMGPRMLLMGVSDPSELTPTWKADFFGGTRAGSTLGGPLEFGGFCAIVLLVYASFYRKLPKKYSVVALLVVLGLVSSATRMAWLGLVLGLSFIAIRTGQKLRLATVGIVCVLLVLAFVIPWMGLQDFVAATVSGQESSVEVHRASLQEKTGYVLKHPLGSGAGTVGPRAAARNPNALEVESGYLLFGMEYGWIGLILFASLCGLIFLTFLQESSNFGIAAGAVAVAMFTMFVFSPIHMDFGLNSWAWLVIGSGIRRHGTAAASLTK